MGSVRISRELEEEIVRVAAKKGLTRSEVFRRALESYCRQESAAPSQSRFDDTIGVVDVPCDLSANIRAIFGEILEEKARKSQA